MHLFSKIPPTFFTVLSSPNKEIYVDCLFIMYQTLDSVEDGFQGDRELIVSKLVDYFEDKQQLHLAEDEEARTSRQKATAVINVLKQNGWIGEEELGDYKTSLNFFDYSIHILDVLEKIMDGSQDEYTGEIYAVYSILSSFNLEEGIGIIEQAYQKTNDVIRKLKSLKANIYSFYYEITKKTNRNDLENMLEKLLIDYKENFFDRAYYNLKTTDSLPRYKRSINQAISTIENNENVMDYLATEAMKLKKIDNYNDAFSYVEDRLRYIVDSFRALEYLILAIDKKNEQYISAATAKILFLTNTSDDVEGLFNRLFKIIIDGHPVDFNYILNLSQVRNLDTGSLYSQRRYRAETIPEEIFEMDDLITDEYKRQKVEAIFKNNIFSKKEINNYVKNLLNEKEFVLANEVEIYSDEDYIRLILVFLYSKSIDMLYTVDVLNEEVKNNFIIFKNFKIIKRSKSK